MANDIDIYKAVSILEGIGIVFTKEQSDILYSFEKQYVDNALPLIEKAMRKSCSSLLCKWKLKASYQGITKWVVIPENNKIASHSVVSVEQAYD